MNGIFGTQANLWSDLSLITTILLGMIAAFGGFQAKKKRFSNHCPVMAGAALLNWVPVLVVMIPRLLGVLNGSVSLTTGQFTLVPIFHGILGIFTQLLMTYTVIRMYLIESLPPKKPLWLMRITISLWFLTIIGGSAVYILSYT
jgi:uncharacterized membrane protein YozB (DUF420 family)